MKKRLLFILLVIFIISLAGCQERNPDTTLEPNYVVVPSASLLETIAEQIKSVFD